MGGIGGLGGLSGVGGIWTPQLSLQLDGGLLWLDATTITGVADGARLTTWPDLSGNSNDAANTDDPRPLYQTNVQNSLPVVEFDGTDAALDITASMVNGDSDRTYALVFADAAADGGNHTGSLMGIGHGADAGTWFVLQARISGTAGTEGFPYVAGYSNDTESATVITTGFHYALVTYDGTTVVVRLDGSQVASEAQALTTDDLGFQIGYSNEGGGAEFLNSSIGEMLVYNSVLSAAQIALLEGYLSAKWGL